MSVSCQSPGPLWYSSCWMPLPTVMFNRAFSSQKFGSLCQCVSRKGSYFLWHYNILRTDCSKKKKYILSSQYSFLISTKRNGMEYSRYCLDVPKGLGNVIIFINNIEIDNSSIFSTVPHDRICMLSLMLSLFCFVISCYYSLLHLLISISLHKCFEGLTASLGKTWSSLGSQWVSLIKLKNRIFLSLVQVDVLSFESPKHIFCLNCSHIRLYFNGCRNCHLIHHIY